jgi:hypothetical protein
MMMLTQANREALPPIYTQDGKGEDAIVFVKFFCPWSQWSWFATEGEPRLDEDGNEVDYEFFGWVFGTFPELGYWTLSQLTEVNGPMGLKIERDRHFKPQTLREVKEHVRSVYGEHAA